MRANKWTLLAFLFLAGVPYAQSPEKVYTTGSVKLRPGCQITKKDIGFYPPSGKFFTQSWTFVYYLDNSAGGYIQFSYLRMGGIIKQTFVHHSHYTPDGELIYKKEIVSAGNWSYNPDPPELKMGASRWWGFYPEFNLDVQMEGLKARFKLKCLTGGFRPWEGPTHYGSQDGDWYDIVVMIPLAELSGTIEVGNKKQEVHGYGYCDHNVQTIWFTTQVEKIFALRSFSKDYSVHILQYIAPARFAHHRLGWLIVIKNNQIIYATDKYTIETSDYLKEPRRGYEYPTKIKIKVDEPYFKLNGEIRGLKLLEMLDVRDQVPVWLESTAAKFIKQPAFLKVKAVVNWNFQSSGFKEEFPAEGIFEVTFSN